MRKSVLLVLSLLVLFVMLRRRQAVAPAPVAVAPVAPSDSLAAPETPSARPPTPMPPLQLHVPKSEIAASQMPQAEVSPSWTPQQSGGNPPAYSPSAPGTYARPSSAAAIASGGASDGTSGITSGSVTVARSAGMPTNPTTTTFTTIPLSPTDAAALETLPRQCQAVYPLRGGFQRARITQSGRGRWNTVLNRTDCVRLLRDSSVRYIEFLPAVDP